MKRVFLTGGSGDIGKEIKSIFEQNKYEVISPDRQTLDLSSKENIISYFNNDKTKYDCFIHCAGFNKTLNVFENNNEYEETFQINYFSFLEIINLIELCKNSKILVVGSLYSFTSREGRMNYSSTKHALLGAVRSLAIKNKFESIVNMLSPGYVETKMTKKNNDLEKINKICKMIPLGRMCSGKEISEVAYFLCSETNSYINGQNIVVDGGLSCGGYNEILDSKA